MSTDLDRILTDAAGGPGDPLDADELWRSGRRRRTVRGLGRVTGALALVAIAGVALTTLLDTDVTLDPIGEVPQDVEVVDILDGLVPAPGDRLERGGAVDHDPDDLPELALNDLQAPLATLGPGCDVGQRVFVERSVVAVLDPITPGVRQFDLEPICMTWTPLGSALIVSPASGEQQPQLLEPDSDLHLRELPTLVERLERRARVIGGLDRGGELLLETAEAPGRIIAFDLDSGAERTLFDLGDDQPPGTLVAAAHRRDGDTVLVVGEQLAGQWIAGLGQRGTPTGIWLQRDEAPPRLVRSLSDVDSAPSDADVTIRDITPPRLLPGADGPVIVSLERGSQDPRSLELVLTTADGASRVVGRLNDVLPNDFGSSFGGQLGPSLDVRGSQVAIGLPTEVAPGGGIVVLVDLATGEWSRAAVQEAAYAWFLDD
jgi:hypothetical protein